MPNDFAPPSQTINAERTPTMDLAILALRHRRSLVTASLIAGLIVGVIVLALPKKYTTTVSFTPAASDISSSLAGLASQVGVSLPTTNPTQSPDFYADVLQSLEIQQPLVETKHRISDGGDSITTNIISYYGIDESDSGKTVAEAIRLLSRKLMKVGFDNQTTIVKVDITTDSRDLSFEVGKQLLDVVNAFNVSSRQTQGAEARRYLSERLDTARVELRRAEGELQTFLTKNRSYQNDPALVFVHDRLDREVNLRQTVYVTLTQAFEQARVDAARNTPAITIVQHPTPALRYDRRNVLLKVIAGMAVGFVGTLLWLMFGEALADARRTAPQTFGELMGLWGEAREDLRGLTRIIGRKSG